MPIEDAARRRDFTINAISWDPLTGEIVDPFDGREDLEARRLRVVDPTTFGDDSLRVLRAVQFAARFELPLDAGDRAHLPRHRARRSAGRAHLGRGREAAAAGGAAVDRLRAGARARRHRPGAARDGRARTAARRMRSGIRKATSGCTR